MSESDEDFRVPRYLSSYHHADITFIDDFLRTMSPSRVGDATSSQEKSLRSAIETLERLQADLPGGQNDPTTRLLKKTVGVVIELAENMSTLVEKTDSQGEEIKEQGTLREKVEKIVKSDIEEQASVIRELFEVSMLLEAKTLGYRGSHEALILRRNLDDVRFAVANGFILALPNYLTRELVNRYDPTGSSVIWWKFTDAVMNAWWDFHEYSRPDPEVEQYACVRSKSLFSNLPWEDNQPLEAVVKEVTRNLSPEVYLCDNRGRLLKSTGDLAEAGNDTLLRQMRFFVPRLVWCFTSAKRILISEYDRINYETACISHYEGLLKQLGRSAETVEELLEHTSDPERNQNDGQRFVYGTALNIRRQKIWRDILGRLRDGHDMGKKSQKRKSDDDGGASASQKPRINLSTSTDSYAAEGLAKVHSTYWSEHQPDRSAHNQEVPSIPSSSGPKASINLAWTMLQDSCIASLHDAQWKYSVWNTKFNTIRKCLHILLSENLCRIAVTGPSALRNVLDYLAHRRHPYDADYFDAIERIEDLMKETTDGLEASGAEKLVTSFSVAMEKEEVLGIDRRSELVRAHMVLQDDDYIQSEDATTEKAIDTFIEEQAPSLSSEEGEGSKGYTDYHILLHWLDSLNPVPTNQESGTTDPEAEAA